MSFYFTSLSGKVCEGARLRCWKMCHKFSQAETFRFQAEVSYSEPIAISLLSPVLLQLQRNPPPAPQEPQEGVLFCFILEGTYFCVTLRCINASRQSRNWDRAHRKQTYDSKRTLGKLPRAQWPRASERGNEC